MTTATAQPNWPSDQSLSDFRQLVSEHFLF